MKHTRILITALLPAVVLSGSTLSAAAEAEPQTEISLTTLLNEMVDRDAVARFPRPDFRLKQQSSYNRASKTPDDPKGWFANHDFNKGANDRNFIRVEENNGQKEWVVMDHDGAGVIVRSWMPYLSADNPDTDIRIRVYLDGATQPVLEGNMLGLFNGTGLIPYPLAHPSLCSAVSFFPIPYAKRCKVTTTQQPFFFQFSFREYAKGTRVKTFTLAEFNAAKALTKQVGETLLHPQRSGAGNPLTLAGTLAGKEANAVELPAGTAAVRELTVKLGNYEEPAVTRSIVLKMEFDGKETVWCPVGDFFGTGLGLHPFQGWERTVAEDGTMTCRWVMPYQQSGKISLVNVGDKPVAVQLAAQVGSWTWDERSMYFHANWRQQKEVPTRPHSDWNYITLKGRGVYVGDTLTIMNPSPKWWGEGDEKIWVDGESFPSLLGTGTEDYYGYSWGGVSTDFYEHPFHAQVRCHQYDKVNRKQDAKEKNTQGYSTETRTRSLDTMPFGSALQLDMEVWSVADRKMDYAVATYWYGFRDTTSDRPTASAEAGSFIHPGMLHSRAELAFIKQKVALGEEPWKTAWEKLRSAEVASLDYTARPRPEVVRGAYNNPNIGSSDFSNDSAAAYTQALQWCLTGKEAHAQKAMVILNAWSATLKTVSGHDTKLLIGMEGVKLCNAAELIRHTDAGWKEEDQKRFELWLRQVFYPPIKDFFPAANGNWDAAMIQTMLAMGVFLDDRAMFNRAVDYYLKGEGNGAIRNYVNAFGECQESGRDQAHTQMGLGFLGCAAEMAWKQGVDLYGASSNRLAVGFEYTAKYNLGHDVPYEPYRSFDGKYFNPSISSKARGRFAPIYERIVYHYHGRKGLEMPYSRQVVAKGDAGGQSGGAHVPWGALMFAKSP